MRRPSPAFQNVMFVLLAVWFLLLAITFFFNRPVTLVWLLPELLLLGLIMAAAYSIGSFIIAHLRLEEVLQPGEEFVLATTAGLGLLSMMVILVGLLGLLTWWTIGLGLFAAIASGFYRIVGLVTPPAYLFGPEDLGDEAPDPISWMQYIVVAIWIIALLNFCFLPPISSESLATTLGVPSQWALSERIAAEACPAGFPTLTSGLYAMALVLRGTHLAMFISALAGGLLCGALYTCAKRYCGPVAARSTFLAAATLPLFVHGLVSAGNALTLALFELCAMVCLVRWFDERRWQWAALAGLFAGLGLGASPLMLFFLPPLVAAVLVWAAIRRHLLRLLRHLALAAVVAAACFAPWSALGAYLQGTPAGLLEPLANLNPPPLLQGHLNILTLPLEISFPRPALPPFEVIGPIFLVFIPFFFITYRKNPASGLAVAIGLSFLGFGEPFGLALEARLAAFALLGVPAALAAHRFAEKGWRKTLAVAMLYLMIGWQIFHSTAMVENAYPSPDRFLLGLETSDQFLARAVDYYPAARWINDNLPADARLKALGQKELLYIHRLVSPTTPERGGELAVSLVNPQTRSGALAALREKGFGYLIVNWREPDSGDPPWPELQHALRSRLLYSGGPVGVYTLDPMPGQQESGGGEDEQEVF